MDRICIFPYTYVHILLLGSTSLTKWTETAFLLLYGSFLNIFDRKYVYVAAVIWFEVGSLFCGVAPSVDFLIFGRAVAGVGAAGSKLYAYSFIG